MADDTKTCPICAETIKAAALKCQFCNSDLTAYASHPGGYGAQPVIDGNSAAIYTVWQWIAVLGTLGSAHLHCWIRSKSTKTAITFQRTPLERGILSKVKESAGFFHFDHFDVLKSLGMHLAGQCVLHLRRGGR